MLCYSSKTEEPQSSDETGTAKASGDVWDVWRYFRFGFDICELRNDTRLPWTFLAEALGQESWGLQLVMCDFRREIVRG